MKIEIISDTGNGYWINSDELLIYDNVYIITQGQDFTINGEKVQVIEND